MIRLTQLYVRNAGIIPELLIPLGAVTFLTGANGTGKTTLIRCLLEPFEGGHNPDLIGPHGDECYIEHTFSDGCVSQKTISRLKYTLVVLNPDGTPKKSPATYLKNLAEGLRLNPTAFVQAAPKERVKLLQQAVPLKFEPEEIEQCGPEILDISKLPQRLDQPAFDAFLANVLEQRKVTNQRLDDRGGTEQTLRKSLPADDGHDWAADLAAIDAEIAEHHNSVHAMDLTAEQVKGKELDALTSQRQAEIEAIHEKYAQMARDVIAKIERLTAEEQKPLFEAMESLKQKRSDIQARADQQIRNSVMREQLETVRGEIKQLATRSSAFDKAIEKLRALKQRKLDALPIPGVEVRADGLYLNGLNFDTQVNTAEQHLLSFELTALTLGEFPFMVYDGSSDLDDENKQALIAGIKARGYQVVMAEPVAGKPLTCSTA